MAKKTGNDNSLAEKDGLAPEYARYDHGLMRRARLLWVLYESDLAVAQELNLPEETVQEWRLRSLPDGEEWQRVKQALRVIPLEHVTRLVSPRGRIQWHETSIQMLQAIVDWLIEQYKTQRLYDENGKPVDELYDVGHKPVRLDGVRPRTAREITDGIDKMHRLILTHLTEHGAAVDSNQQRRYERQMMMQHIMRVALEKLGPDVADQLRLALLESRTSEALDAGLDELTQGEEE